MCPTDPERLPLAWLTHFAARDPRAPALITGRATLDRGTLLERIGRRAAAMAARGVVRGQRVALYTDDDLELILSLYAAWSLGAVAMPVPITQTDGKLRLIESIVPPDVGFRGAGYEPGYDRGFPLHAMEDAAEPLAPVAVDPADLAMIQFTSGTSGTPKAVPMTFAALAHNAYETAEMLAIREADRILINSPPYYTSPIVHVLTLWSHGGSVAVERGLLFGEGLLELLLQHGCTGFGGVPVHFVRLLAALEEGTNAPAALRFLMNSGEHLPRPVLQGIRAALPDVAFYCVYGLTEVAGRLCVLDPADTDRKPGSVGHPLPGMRVTVRGEDGVELPSGEDGEVFVDGVCLMSGYLNNPEANAEALTANGFATGDVGCLDEDGYLYLRGRKDDVIKVGGEKVSIAMIEEAVHGFAPFADFLVVPRFDERMGHIPHLQYVLGPGERFHRKDLLRLLRARLPANHIPTSFEQLDEIPRAASGKKVRRRG